jgi:hypothetical protein
MKTLGVFRVTVIAVVGSLALTSCFVGSGDCVDGCEDQLEVCQQSGDLIQQCESDYRSCVQGCTE